MESIQDQINKRAADSLGLTLGMDPVSQAVADEMNRTKQLGIAQTQLNQQRQAGIDKQAADLKAKDSRYQGASFLDALQQDLPQMFRKKEAPGQAIYGAPQGGY